MAKCFCSQVATEVGDYSFMPVSKDTIKIFENEKLIGRTSEVIVANTILHREKLEKKCEEKFGWVMLKYWAKNSELEGTDLYDYLSSKCVDNGIPIDYLDRHSKDILS